MPAWTYQSAAPYTSRRYAYSCKWPPSPRVEDDTTQPSGVEDGEPPSNTRGAVDQASLIDDIPQEPPDRRYVYVPSSTTGDDASRLRSSSLKEQFRDRPSMSKRGGVTAIDTNLNEPPVFTERVSTPYAYSNVHSEPRPIAPDVHLRPPSPYAPPKSSTGPRREDDVLEDSDLEVEDALRLRTERKPSRYSFVKGDLHKEDFRKVLREPEPTSAQPSSPKSKHIPGSRRSSRSGRSRRSSPSRPGSPHRCSSPPPRASSRHRNASSPPRASSHHRQTSSPTQIEPGSHHPGTGSRPPSRGETRGRFSAPFTPTSHLFSSGKSYDADAGQRFMYPLSIPHDRSAMPPIYGRSGTPPSISPFVEKQSSPTSKLPPNYPSSLPYPDIDHVDQISMPAEEHYQFDHAAKPTSRQQPREISTATYPSSNVSADSRNAGLGPSTPRSRQVDWDDPDNTSSMKTRREVKSISKTSEQGPGTSRPPRYVDEAPENNIGLPRKKSIKSQAASSQLARGKTVKRDSLTVDVDRPLPSCPRSESSARHNDWYSLQGYPNFDICPSCFNEVFCNTPFAIHFSQRRLNERPVERYCDFSSSWVRLAWLLTLKQQRKSLDLIFGMADMANNERPCPGDREISIDRMTWYGVVNPKDGLHIANFAVCSPDKMMIEMLFPSMRGYFTKLSNGPHYTIDRHICSLRTTSRRFPKYLDLLVELDAEAQSMGQNPKFDRFTQLVRDNAFKGECVRDKALFRKPWHFIPSLPEFTVCEECYELLIWPAIQNPSSSTSSALPRMFNKTIQLVPGEDPEVGSSCCLYSPRMRRVWSNSVKDVDIVYLKRKATERKRAQNRLSMERKGLIGWMAGAERESNQWDHARVELMGLEREWAAWE